jgi:hypothetical protein
MEALKSLVQPLVGNVAGNSVVDGMKLVVLGGTVETARRMSSSAWQVTTLPYCYPSSLTIHIFAGRRLLIVSH